MKFEHIYAYPFNVWSFGFDGWKQIEPPIRMKHSSNEDLDANGYEQCTTAPDYSMLPGSMDIWHKPTVGAGYPYAVQVTMPTFNNILVFVRSDPELLALAKECMPMAKYYMDAESLTAIGKTLNKLFRALHGHDVAWTCKDCSPNAGELTIEFTDDF